MAEEEQKQAQEGAQQDQAKPTGSGKGVFLGLIGAIVVINAIIALVLIQVTRPKSPAEKMAEAKADSAATQATLSSAGGVTTEEPVEAIVNIADTDGERFIKLGVVFEYDEKEKTLGEALEKHRPRIKNAMIDLLSTMNLMELNEPDAKDKIRKELLRRVNAMLPKKQGQIRDVLLVEYIIQ